MTSYQRNRLSSSCTLAWKKWKEVERMVRRAWTVSAPGSNGVPYKHCKYATDVLCFQWRLIRTVWQKQIIPKAWRRAGGILKPKEKDALNISQFWPICLLNEGQTFFSIVSQKISTYLERNKYINTLVQKADIPGLSGCLEHRGMIWQPIQAAKKEKICDLLWLGQCNWPNSPGTPLENL